MKKTNGSHAERAARLRRISENPKLPTTLRKDAARTSKNLEALARHQARKLAAAEPAKPTGDTNVAASLRNSGDSLQIQIAGKRMPAFEGARGG